MPNPGEFDNESDFMEACMAAMHNEGKDQDQAVAACSSMWKEKSFYGLTMEDAVKRFIKAMSKDEELMHIRMEFEKLTNPMMEMDMPKPMNGVMEVFDDYVIACFDEKFYKVNYRMEGEQVVFDERDKWVEVEEQWVEKAIGKSIKDIKAGARHSMSDRKDMQDLHDIAVRQGAVCKSKTKSAKSNALKAVLESPYELVVENHIVLFGGRDATGFVYGKNHDGSMGEFFTANTQLESDYTKTGRLYVDFEHGRDPDAIGNTPNSVLGYVDWKTAKVDDDGVIVRRVLNRRHEYMKWLEPLIRAGLVGNSSECIEGEGTKADNGEITKWPLKRDSLTVTPMEPRMLDGNIVTALEAMAKAIPYYKSLITSNAALPDTDDKPIEPKPIQSNTHKGKENKMDNELKTAIAEIAAKAVADVLAEREAKQQAEVAKQAELKAAEDAGYKKALEDMKNNPAPTFYHSTEPTNDDNDGVQAFKSWMATGQTNSGLIRPDAEFLKSHGSYFVGKEGKAAWNVNDGQTGGFLVPDPLYNQIIEKRNIASWVRQLPVQHFETPADHLLVPRESTSMTDFVLTAEAGSYDENEGTVTQKDLIQYKYTKLTKVSEEFLMYNTTNWESWFTNALGRAVAGTENTIYTTATGTSEPEGIVTGATVANTTATTDVILPSELSALIGYLGDGYNVPSECGMLMANATKWYLKGSGGTSYTPFAYVSTPQDGDFFGYKAVVDDDLDPYTTASAKCVVFGNYSYYATIEKPGMIVARNPYLYQATGQIGIFASIFRGGGVLQSEAFYYLTNKAS